jgi:hypothetical protein
MPLRPFCSRKREGLPADQEDHQAQFYEEYRKLSEEYDKEFFKKHEEDLNTTLIFVSSASGFYGHVLTRVLGWSVLRRHVRIHHRSQLPAQARPG